MAELKGKPRYDAPPLIATQRPRCPPYVDDYGVDDLLPYLDAVARRPYTQGLHAAWDLKRGERVLLRVDNWHDPLVIEACKRIFEKYGVRYEILMVDKGPLPAWEGHDEVEYYLRRTRELAEWMDEWDRISAEGRYDKLLWGYGGPVLCDDKIKIQRMPFITPELLASPAHTLPWEVIHAVDEWTWEHICASKRLHIIDPEGTDLWYTNHDQYYDAGRRRLNHDLVASTWAGNVRFGETYLPGHVLGRPWVYLPGMEDGNGVIAGTSNHIAPVPWTQLVVADSRIVEINEGGRFGEKLRKLKADTDDLVYPGFPGKGLFWWWEASIGTNPHIHRPRNGFATGWLSCLYERMRSGVIHIGFGTIISSMDERRAARQGLPVGHWHLHLYFPTMTGETAGGERIEIIKDGHLLAFDEPRIRRIAAKYGDPDLLLSESWIPAIPGINVKGDYWAHYANDPMKWVRSELAICQDFHHLFADLVGGDPRYCRRITPDWKVADEHGAHCGHHGQGRHPTLTEVAAELTREGHEAHPGAMVDAAKHHDDVL